MSADLSLAQARRISLAAQGFGKPRPARTTASNVLKTVKGIHALQIDTVSALVRSHYLPVFSRIGPYPISAMDKLLNVTHQLIELDAHQASIVPVELEPALRGRARWTERWGAWRRDIENRRPGYVSSVEKFLRSSGPVTAGDLPEPHKRARPPAEELTVRRRDGLPYAETSLLWWRGSSDSADTLEFLRARGDVMLAGRGPGFKRLYDVRSNVLPAGPSAIPKDVNRALTHLAAKALGVATLADIANYFQVKIAPTRVAIRELLDAGEVKAVKVEGFNEQAYLCKGAKCPAKIEARALLSPFDSLTWRRPRVKQLFDFEFSFEIYVPEAKRKYGYFVLPFLLGDQLVARTDLKADRATSTLIVKSVFHEPGFPPARTRSHLKEALLEMAGWLDLEKVAYPRRF